MYGLLAVSALHYANENPEKRSEYTVISTRYQTVAVKSFLTRITDVNEKNCLGSTLLATLIFLLSTHSIANPQDREVITASDVAQSFLLLQGVRGILSSPSSDVQKWAQEGNLAPLFRPFPQASSGTRSAVFLTQLNKLVALSQEAALSSSVANAGNEAQMQASCLLAAVDALRDSYTSIDLSPDGQRRLWAWPYFVSQVFVEMIGKSDPLALVVLAHFAAIAVRFERWHWARRGWSQNVMAMVAQTLKEERWKEWIDLPIRCIERGLDLYTV